MKPSPLVLTALIAAGTGCATAASLPVGFVGIRSDVTVTVMEPPYKGSGHGVWMGNGFVLTAQHLFRHYKAGDAIYITPPFSKPLLVTLAVKGSLPDTDLALLRISGSTMPPSIRVLHSPPVCQNDEQPADRMKIVAGNVSFPTYASPYGVTHHPDGKESAVWTTSVFSHSTSGAGIYDVKHGCLAGIVLPDLLYEAYRTRMNIQSTTVQFDKQSYRSRLNIGMQIHQLIGTRAELDVFSFITKTAEPDATTSYQTSLLGGDSSSSKNSRCNSHS